MLSWAEHEKNLLSGGQDFFVWQESSSKQSPTFSYVVVLHNSNKKL